MLSVNIGWKYRFISSSSSYVGESEYTKLGKGNGDGNGRMRWRPAPNVLISCQMRRESDAGNWKIREAFKSLINSLNVWRLSNAIAEWADEIKERGMVQRRQLYSHEDWVKHRSAKRHIRHLLSSFSSRVILSLVPPLCIVGTISVAIATYNTAVSNAWLPSFMPLLHASSSLTYELTAPALALLLVFRTEGSYNRYDEGRKTWTQVISSTKDFARHAIIWIRHSNSDAPALKSLLLSYIMAFPVALKCQIIHGSDLEHDLRNLLSEEDLALLLHSNHQPNFVIHLLSETLEHLQLDDSKIHILDSHISQFNESVSVCERLIRSPIPLSYTRLTARFLVLWHLILPIILWDQCHWTVIPATLFSAATLFCIEEVAVLIEEPFPILALDKMCALVHENIEEMLKFESVIEGHLQMKLEKLRGDHVPKLNGSASNTFFKL